MQSSYNLIKSTVTTVGDNKVIATKYKRDGFNKDESIEDVVDDNSTLQSYENIGLGIIKNAKKEAEEIILKSLEKSAAIEKAAYEEGYEKGTENGYEDGYKSGYEKSLADMESKVLEELTKAEKILSSAEEDYKNYMDKKRTEILNLALDMAKVISKKELELSDGVLNLIDPILEKSKGEENIVIKCNTVHVDSIKKRLSYWQGAYSIKGEIFVLEDTFMEPGNAEVQKRTGKTIVGIDIALQNLEELILK